MSFLEALSSNPFLLSALLAGLMASVVSGIVGSYIVVKRIAFISGSLSHAVLGGIGCSLWLQHARGINWISPLQGALLTAVAAAVIMGWIRVNYKQREDSVIAALWSVGMAVGVLFISQTPGYNVELTNFLVGNILWVSTEDLAFIALLDLIVLITVSLLHTRLIAICFDEEQARLQGLYVPLLYLLLLILTAISIVLLIQIVGSVLVMTMLTIPAAIANLFTKHLSTMMIIAVFLNVCFNVSGLMISYEWELPPGATIAMIAGIIYVVALGFKKNSAN